MFEASRIEIQKSLIEQGNFYSWSIQQVFFHLIWFLYIIRIYDCKYSQGSVTTFYHRAELRLTDTSVFAILGPHFPSDSDIIRIKLMEQEEKATRENEDAKKSYAFLSSIRKGNDITVRDDHLDFQLLLDQDYIQS